MIEGSFLEVRNVPQMNHKMHAVKPVSWQLIGIICILLLAGLLLWHGNANSWQASNALAAQVYFDGEYRVADGPWQKITPGVHIPATKGDVNLRGNFHMLAPDGTYVGLCDEETPIAFYTDHISLTFFSDGNEPYMVDSENPLFGDAACAATWTAHFVTGNTQGPIEILVHNPHTFGNETAVDRMLSGIALWTGIDFEKAMLTQGEPQRDAGIFLMIISLLLLGSALFSALIHIKTGGVLWVLGGAVLFAGTYLVYGVDSISFWSDSVVTNTVMLGASMIFYMLFLSLVLVHFLKGTKKIGEICALLLGAFDGILFLLPVLTDVLFYDTWIYWFAVQSAVNLVLIGCFVKEYLSEKKRNNWLYMGAILPLIAFGVDGVMTMLGLWKGGLVSKYVFVALLVASMVMVLRIIPSSINAAAKAKELEQEKNALDAQLSQSRISTMISQIRPHFIYNTLGSIEQLCSIDPPKAGELVHNFAKYLRGNFGELDNPKPILMSREMEHVRHYVSIEKVRFPDMTFLFEMNSGDFHIPALTIQPIVENAIKHGLMKLPKGGTIRVVSYETDTHYCVSVEDDGMGFDTRELLDERKHVGIRNIRGRLKAMVGGALEIESTIGAGTKVWITIPKEVEK